jgi:hypothetical protein
MPVDAIATSLRLSWTLSEFFSSGNSNFVDRLSAVLGIQPSSVKIVQVWEGSVFIAFTIIPGSTADATAA